MNPNPRYIALEGAYNVRDIGGYPTHDGRQTRWRTL
ncbi:MAG: tyrosine-protein phosphatase, partial [Anaerolineae bacterium]|nr:tyrosine-protein phosphatase [Anaerolineae bacterium]